MTSVAEVCYLGPKKCSGTLFSQCWAEGQTENTCALAPSEGAHSEFGRAVHHDDLTAGRGYLVDLRYQHDGGHIPPGAENLLHTPLVASARVHGRRRCAHRTPNFRIPPPKTSTNANIVRQPVFRDKHANKIAEANRRAGAISCTPATKPPRSRADSCTRPGQVFDGVLNCELGDDLFLLLAPWEGLQAGTQRVPHPCHRRSTRQRGQRLRKKGRSEYLLIATGHQQFREPLGTGRREETNKPAPHSSAPASPHNHDSATTKRKWTEYQTCLTWAGDGGAPEGAASRRLRRNQHARDAQTTRTH
jgi:hypothetical protein